MALEIPKALAVTDHLYLIEGPYQSRFPFCNGFLILGSTETVLIDTGIGEAGIKELDALQRIDTLVLSHSHPDHILAWHVLKDRRLLCPAEMPEAVHDLDLLGERFMGDAEKGAYWHRCVADLLGLHPLREPDGRFSDGDLLDFGTVRLRALRAPGHLGDHYCFFEEQSGVLLTTDVDFTGFGPWYGNPESDIAMFRDDIERLMALPYDRLYTAHKATPYSSDKEVFRRFLDASSRHRVTVLDLCRRPVTLDQLIDASPFYQDRMPDKVIQRVFEKNMILKNIECLIGEGKLETVNGRYQAVAQDL